jgi:hypothetical protein
MLGSILRGSKRSSGLARDMESINHCAPPLAHPAHAPLERHGSSPNLIVPKTHAGSKLPDHYLSLTLVNF